MIHWCYEKCFYCFVQTWQWQHPHNMEFPGILKRPQGVDGQKIGRMEDVEIAFRYWQKMKCGKFGYTLFYGNPPPARIYRCFFPIFLGILGYQTFIFPWFLGSKGGT